MYKSYQASAGCQGIWKRSELRIRFYAELITKDTKDIQASQLQTWLENHGYEAVASADLATVQIKTLQKTNCMTSMGEVCGYDFWLSIKPILGGHDYQAHRNHQSAWIPGYGRRAISTQASIRKNLNLMPDCPTLLKCLNQGIDCNDFKL